MSRLFLRFAERLARSEDGAFDGGAEWLVLDDGGAVQDLGRGNVVELGAWTREHVPWADDPARVVVFVPTAETLAIGVTVPGRNAGQIRKAAPYAIEEFVTDDIETMHVACGPISRNEPVRCLVARSDNVRDWLDCLRAAGIAPGCMTADAMALPTEADAVTVAYDDDTALVRAGEQIGCVDLPNLLPALATLHDVVEAAGEAPVLCEVNGALSDVDVRAAGFDESRSAEADGCDSLLGHLATHFDAASPIDLLQGEFAVRRRAGAAWTRWRAVAAALVAWGVLGLIVAAAQGLWASRQADGYRAAAVAIYQEVYGVDRVAGNPAARMRRQLGQAPIETLGFHALLGNLGVALDEVAGRYELRSITFSERSGFGAEVVIASLDALEELQSVLAERGFELEMVSAEQQPDDRVRANVRLSDAS